MATVVSMTADKINELMADQVVFGEVGSNGHLILTTKGGTQRDAGVVVEPLKAWPVGSIFIGVSSANPATMLGGGTWVRWGKGRIPVSLNESDADFNTVEEVGGSKTRQLTVANLPAHEHDMSHDHPDSTTSSTGNHRHTMPRGNVAGNATNAVLQANVDGTADGYTGYDGTHNHTVNIITREKTTGNGFDQGLTRTAFDIMNPYITCYMWKRTA